VSNSDYREQLIAVGKELYNRGLQTTRSGNISVRDGEQFLITKTGANLGQLRESDLVSVDIPPHVPFLPTLPAKVRYTVQYTMPLTRSRLCTHIRFMQSHSLRL